MIRFSIRSVRVQISVLFFAAAALWLATDTGGAAAVCLLSSLLHECGHFVMLAACGVRPGSVTAGIFGIRLEHRAADSRQSVLISLAGPAANLLAAGAAWAMGLHQIALINLSIGAMNLLPVEMLDGGQALYHFLTLRMEEEKARRLTTASSFIVIVPLATAAFYLLISNGYNFSLLAVCVYLILLLFLKKV